MTHILYAVHYEYLVGLGPLGLFSKFANIFFSLGENEKVVAGVAIPGKIEKIVDGAADCKLFA